MALTDEKIIEIRKTERAGVTTPWGDTLAFARAIESEATAPLLARIAELERLCDATYVANGADAYNHACSEMERWQAERAAAGKEVGTEGSLCDGMAWLYQTMAEKEERIAALTAQVEQAAQPVAWRHSKTFCLYETEEEVPLADGDEWADPLYTAPPKAVPLTQDQRNSVISAAENALDSDINLSWRNALIDAVEQAHGITPATVEKG